MPKVADTFVVSADPDLVDMGKGIIGRIRGHSRQDFRVQVACTMGDAARGPTILRDGVAPGGAWTYEDEGGSAEGPLPGFEDGDYASNYEGRTLGNVDESNTKICGEVFEITECASW